MILHRRNCLFFLFLLTVALYLPSINAPFTFDDKTYIVNNPDIRQINNPLVHFNSQNHQTRILVFYSFALNYAVCGLNVFGYHLVNLFVHIINGWLVFWLAIQLWTFNNYRSRDEATVTSFIVALLFICHPVQTEAVTYITQRFTIISAMFYLLSLNAFIQILIRKAKVLWGIICVGACLAAVFSKENAYTLPIMGAAIVFVLYQFKRMKFDRRIVLAISGFVVVLFLAIIFFSKINPKFIFCGHGQESGSHEGDIITWNSYALTQGKVMLTYLKLLVWPWPQNLDYDFPLVKNVFSFSAVSGIFIYLGCLFFGIKLRKVNPVIAIGLLWFFVTFIVEASVIPIHHVIFEHRLYLPSIGFFIIVVELLSQIIPAKRIFYQVLFLIVLMFCALTIYRNYVWSDEIRLWKQTVTQSPNKFRPHLNLGTAFLANGKHDQALNEFNKVITLNKKSSEAYNNRGIVYMTQKKYLLAWDDFNRALIITPAYSQAQVNKIVLSIILGRFENVEKEIDRLAVDSQDIASSHSLKGFYFFKRGDMVQAINYFNQALLINPHNASDLRMRGSAFGIQKDFGKAEKDFTTVLRDDPKDVWAIIGLGKVAWVRKNYEETIKILNKAESLQPNIVEIYALRAKAFDSLNQIQKADEDRLKVQKLITGFNLTQQN